MAMQIPVNDRWPGYPPWDSQSYWLGVVTAFAFFQADHDTEENFKRGNNTAICTFRLPYVENPEPEDLGRFGAAVRSLNDEATVLYWRSVPGPRGGEYYIELASTEGYLGWMPPDNDEEWRS